MKEETAIKINDEEQDVYEKRIFNKKYDENWNLSSYTSELRYNDNDRFFAFIDFNADGEGKFLECPRCLEYGFHHKLYAKIKKDNEGAQPDDDQFGSCHECGNTFPLYQAHIESEIKDSLETVSNPFESSESIFMSVPKKKRKKNRLKDYGQDEDIQRETAREIW